MSFDAWGQRRLSNDWDYGVSQDTLKTLKEYTDKGYTGEEELDNVALVDLNGRVYDPTVGRLISADPIMGGNRYAYVGDNPLRFTDPTGHCSVSIVGFSIGGGEGCGKKITSGLAKGLRYAGQEVSNYAPEIAAVVAAYYTGGAASGLFGTSFWGSVGTGAAAGGSFAATDTTLHGGNGSRIFDNGLRGAAIGGVGGGLLYGANAVTSYSNGNFGVGLVSHGVAGGLASEAAGRSFHQGFELGGFAYAAYWGYQQMVNGEAPSWNRGHGTQPKGKDFPATQETQKYNNFGRAVPLNGQVCFACEGSTFSDVMDAYPGMNALATLHDVWGDLFEDAYGSYPIWYNVGTMLPAAAFTYSALLNTTVGYGIASGREADGGGL